MPFERELPAVVLPAPIAQDLVKALADLLLASAGRPTTMRSGTMRAKITADHLERTALVYVRQSTPGQVRDHLGESAPPVWPRDVARELGFHRVETIDDDLGISGSGFAERPGFQRLLTTVVLGDGRRRAGARSVAPRAQ